MPPLLARPVEYISRRAFLWGIVALAGLLPFRGVRGGPTAEHRPSLKALGPFLDTLLPEDSTPSATQLGTHSALMEQAHQRRDVARLLELGCGWLDTEARERGATDFAELDEAGREAIVTVAERSPSYSVARAFFNFTQSEAFRYYYAQPAAWSGLGFSGPPQPMGFLDFAKPPADAG